MPSDKAEDVAEDMAEDTAEDTAAHESTRRPGRPPKPAPDPLGQLLWTWLRAKQLSPQEFARRLGVSRTTLSRLLQSKTRYMLRTSVADLCAALQLTEDERVAFVQAFLALEDEALAEPEAPDAASGRMRSAAAIAPTAPDSGRRQARRANRQTPHTPTTTQGGNGSHPLAQQLDAHGLSSSELARALGVAPSTVTRALHQQTQRTHALDPEHVARALQLDAVDRREFLTIALEAGFFAVTARNLNVARSAGPFAALERSLGQSLEDVEQEVIVLRRRRNQGDVKQAFERARDLFAQLFAPPHGRSASVRNSLELARVKLLVGFEYCEVQAAYLPWYAREARMIETLNRIEQEVLRQFPPIQFASASGHLFNLRAPLYRRRPHGQSSDAAYEQGVFDFTYALQRTISAREEPTLHIELLRNRAHTHLLHHELAKWRGDLEIAERLAHTLRGEEGQQFQALVTYSWGEGYKRAAELPNQPAAARAGHLRKALVYLREGEESFERDPLWHGYALLAAIAQAQCLTSSAPEEAQRRLTALHERAQRLYPSLLDKIERAAAAVGHG